MKTDIEIAQSCTLLTITAIGAKLGLTEEQLIYMADAVLASIGEMQRGE